MKTLWAAAVFLFIAQTAAYAAPALILDPPGNRNQTIPVFPDVVERRIESQMIKGNARGTAPTADMILSTNFDNVVRLMKSDLGSSRPILTEIKRAAKIYGVDPLAVLGCIAGEHIFNVKASMEMQDMIVRAKKALPYWSAKFSDNDVDLAEILTHPEFDRCSGDSQYNYWICAQDVWSSQFSGQILADGRQMPAKSLRTVFFNPIGTGYTYGLGQLDPLRVLMVTDIVSKKSGLPFVTVNDASEIYDALLDPYQTVHYVAANVAMIVSTFNRISGFDISQNPGVIATMYNLGHEWSHARERRDQNAESMKTTGQIAYPEENFYGWYINDRADELQHLLDLVN